MTQDTWQRLAAEFDEFPILRAEPVPDEEIEAASAALGLPFPQDYREFLQRCGAAMVGPYPILGLRQAEVMGVESWNVVEVNRQYRAQGWPGVDKWLIISIDHAGNPMGIGPDGRVWVYDHDFRKTLCLAEDFEDFLRRECLRV